MPIIGLKFYERNNMAKTEYILMNLRTNLKVVLNYKGKLNKFGKSPQPHDEICDIVNISKLGNKFEYRISDGDVYYPSVYYNEMDLVLHPLSDLTKEIEDEGKKFIPLLELLKLAYNNIFNYVPEITSYNLLFDDESFGIIAYNNEEERVSLYYIDNIKDNKFEFWISGYEMSIRQFDFFQNLVKWHFDLGGFIQKGQAIDVNSLKNNPY